jgi:hypothetical protein
MPNCLRCEGTRFRMEEINVANSSLRWLAVVCTDCGGIQTVVDYFGHKSIVNQLDDIQKHLGMKV